MINTLKELNENVLFDDKIYKEPITKCNKAKEWMTSLVYAYDREEIITLMEQCIEERNKDINLALNEAVNE